MLRSKTIILICVLALYLAASQSLLAATRYPVTIKDSRGKSITILREPKRIVSTVPSNTEILFALGLDSRIVGVGNWDDYPPAAKRKPKVGDHVISVEKVISLRPDIVIAHAKLNQDVIPVLEKYGIPVVAINPKTIEQVEQDIRLIGKVTNREKEAAIIAGRIESAKELVERKVARIKTRPQVLVSVQPDPLWVAGPKTFVDEMIRIAGGSNIASDAKPGYNQFSAEAAVWRRPDIIIATSPGSRKVFTSGVWKSTKAARTRRIYRTDPNYLFRPGPRLAIGILNMAKMIHPKIFK